MSQEPGRFLAACLGWGAGAPSSCTAGCPRGPTTPLSSLLPSVKWLRVRAGQPGGAWGTSGSAGSSSCGGSARSPGKGRAWWRQGCVPAPAMLAAPSSGERGFGAAAPRDVLAVAVLAPAAGKWVKRCLNLQLEKRAKQEKGIKGRRGRRKRLKARHELRGNPMLLHSPTDAGGEAAERGEQADGEGKEE